MIEAVFHPSFWYLLIPSALLALAGLLAAQHYVHIFQLESYEHSQFFLRLKEDRSYSQRLIKTLLISILIAIGFIFLLSLPLIEIFGNAIYRDLAFISTGCLVIMFYMLARYQKWKKQPSNKPLKVTSRVVRLNISLWLVLLAAQFFLFFTILAVRYYLNGLLDLLGWDIQIDLGLIFWFILLVLPIGALLPRLLALASILVQPIENAFMKRKKADAQAH